KGGGHATSALRVAPPLSLTVAEAEEGAALLEAARERGLLIGKGGGHATSALRVAPPLSLTVAEAEEGAALLEDALRAAY
ncbi:hypothetical protein ACWDYF_00680, partial [Streptomyces sp. NPDC003284]